MRSVMMMTEPMPSLASGSFADIKRVVFAFLNIPTCIYTELRGSLAILELIFNGVRQQQQQAV